MVDLVKESTEKLVRMRDDFRASSQTRKIIEAELARRERQHPDTGTLSLFGWRNPEKLNDAREGQ